MDLKSRIKILCTHFGLSVREFERECNLNRGNISNMTGALGTDKVSKIIAKYPEIDLNWLITGRGEMIRETEPEQREVLHTEQKSDIEELKNLIEEQEIILRKQKELFETLCKPLTNLPAK